MNTTKNILIVEDDIDMQKNLKRVIMWGNGNINIIQAYTNEEAIKHFEENKDSLDLIAFDGYLESNGRTENTIFLIEKIRANFSGIMVAMSSSLSIQQIQMERGCNYSIDCKSELPNLISSLI